LSVWQFYEARIMRTSLLGIDLISVRQIQYGASHFFDYATL